MFDWLFPKMNSFEYRIIMLENDMREYITTIVAHHQMANGDLLHLTCKPESPTRPEFYRVPLRIIEVCHDHGHDHGATVLHVRFDKPTVA